MDSRGDFEQDLDQISEKQLLLEIMVELKSIRYGLQTGQYSEQQNPTVSESEDRYRCMSCGKTVQESERQSHLVDKHNAPAEMPYEMEFEAL